MRPAATRPAGCETGGCGAVEVHPQALQSLRVDFDTASAVADPDLRILDGDLQLHRTFRQFGQLAALLGRQLPNRQVRQAGHLALQRRPPDGRGRAVAVQGDSVGTAAGASQAAVVGLADLDPVAQLAGQAVLPEIGLVGVGDAAPEQQRAVVVVGRHVQREGQHPHHHAFVGLRRVAGQRERVVGVEAAVHVGDLERGFEDGGFDGH